MMQSVCKKYIFLQGTGRQKLLITRKTIAETIQYIQGLIQKNYELRCWMHWKKIYFMSCSKMFKYELYLGEERRNCILPALQQVPYIIEGALETTLMCPYLTKNSWHATPPLPTKVKFFQLHIPFLVTLLEHTAHSHSNSNPCTTILLIVSKIYFQAPATDTRYFARSKFSRS